MNSDLENVFSIAGLLRKVDVPEGKSGYWTVERMEITEQEASFAGIRAMFNSGRGSIQAGSYTRLTYGSSIVMSDSPDELRDHRSVVQAARGNGLIQGLGLGVVLQACLDKTPWVEHVTVIERSEDVIALVAEHYQKRYGDKLTIIHADAFEWKPPRGVHYDFVWHDIWTDLCTDNLADMAKLHRKYGKRCDWQGSWGKEFLKMEQRREKRNGWY